MLSGYAKREWTTILVIGAMLGTALLLNGWWVPAVLVLLVAAAGALFFRDPHRRTPSQRGVVVAPADGRISSVHDVEHFGPFDEPAVCVRIFMSVLDVHINRSPCHGIITRITHKPGDHMNTLNPRSAEVNESNLLILAHPIRRTPVAAVRQIAGLLARTIHCAAKEQQILQRGQRFGMIKLGSTTEVYLPRSLEPEVTVTQGQHVAAGVTVVARVRTPTQDDSPPPQRTVARSAPRSVAPTP